MPQNSDVHVASRPPRDSGRVNGSTVVHHILFVDHHQLADEQIDARLQHRVNTPEPGGRVIEQDKPWESWAVFAYNHVMQADDGLFRMYYDCIEGTGLPPGGNKAKRKEEDRLNNLGSLSHRRICLATSADGVTWAKPNLGIFSWNNSATGVVTKENNILLEDSGVSVFRDTKPGVPPEERYKMVCSAGAYASPDGLRWKKLPFAPTAVSRTEMFEIDLRLTSFMHADG